MSEFKIKVARIERTADSRAAPQVLHHISN